MAIRQCKECGADVSKDVRFCPHCGASQSKEKTGTESGAYDAYETEWDQSATPSSKQGSSAADNKAITGFILAVVSFFMPVPFLDMAMSVAGIVLGSQAKNDENLTKEGIATASLVVGICTLVYNIFFWLILGNLVI